MIKNLPFMKTEKEMNRQQIVGLRKDSVGFTKY